MNYPTFTYNNESVIMKPGNQFTMQELKSRLHQMDIDAIDISSKPELVSLYESTLRDDRNKFKLFDRLQKDTILYNSKMGISVNTINDRMNPERSKVIGLKYEKQKIPYQETENEENNIRKQEIKLRRPQNKINNKLNSRNNFFGNNKNEQNEDNDNTYMEEENNYHNNNINNNKFNYNNNSGNFQNNESGYSDINNTNNYNNNYNYRNNNNMNNNRYGYNNNNEKIYTNSPENYTPYQEPENQINNKNHLVQNIIPNTENIENTKSDVESNFSFFSGFSTFKNKKQICFHILTGFIVICLALGLLYLYREFSESINGFFSNIYSTISHPGEIINSVFSLLRNYWYLIPIILICLIIIISILKRYKLRKRCEEIFRKILDDLRTDDENRSISEEDIYRKYVQGYGISWKKFEKNYLPILRKMRGKNHKLKEFSENIEGKPVKFWEYYP